MNALHFDTITSREEIERGKPHPDIFQCAARRLGLAYEECYVFEDSRQGIQASYAVGCKTIMIPDLTEPDDKTIQLCDGVFPSLLDVLQAIKNQEI